MKPRINVVTLAVDDLEKSLAFYRDGLGLPTRGILGRQFEGSDTEPAGALGYFEMQEGLVFALYPRAELAKDAGLPNSGRSALEFSLGYFVSKREDVDALLHRAGSAGATVIGEPHDRPWGIYSGYFKDLDGHLWEIIWSPQFPVAD